LPGYGTEDFIREIRALIGERPKIEVLQERPPTEAPVDDRIMEFIRQVIHKYDPEAVTAPCLITGYTDAAHWQKLGLKCYGFSPLLLPKDVSFMHLLHGHDERIPIEGFRFGLRVLFDLVVRLVT
jgi:acetylornithine deacetylase/succinyl-diaminopimelate desuccinylase-like protein